MNAMCKCRNLPLRCCRELAAIPIRERDVRHRRVDGVAQADELPLPARQGQRGTGYCKNQHVHRTHHFNVGLRYAGAFEQPYAGMVRDFVYVGVGRFAAWQRLHEDQGRTTAGEHRNQQRDKHDYQGDAMKGVLDNAHCMKHAKSYPMDKECPDCWINRIVKDVMFEQYHPNRVRFPILMHDLDLLDKGIEP